MILVNLLMLAVIGTTASLSTRFFSPVELQDRFEEGQKLYALGAYDKAIKRYEVILSTESNAMINVEEVTVSVDEFILPVRVGATYQLGNTYNKLGLDKLQRSMFLRAEKKDAEADERYEEALRDLNLSRDYFRNLAVNELVEERTRVMAQYQMIQTSYQLKDYGQVIEEGDALLENFPHSLYEASVFYDKAWSYFELEEYEEAIKSFEQVLILAPRGSNADRSLFQISESYEKLERYDDALKYLDRLIARYDFSQMTEEEIIEMTTLKLKGVVKETVRELVAKAHLKKGDIYAEAGRIDEALATYGLLPTEYAAEPVLVQNSYIRTAELVQKERGTAAAIAAYKDAIEKVEDKIFQARTQLTVALMLFDEAEYLKSAGEYEIYLKAYADVAERIGFDRDKVLFRIAQSHQEHGRSIRGEDPAGADAAIAEALTRYNQLLNESTGGSLMPDVLFNAGFANQLVKDNAAAKPLYQQLVKDYADHPAAPNGLLQLARIDYAAADWSGAESTYKSFLDRFPESDLRNTARMELGLTYKRVNDTDGAIAAYESVEEGWEQWPTVQVELAELYIGKQNYAGARKALAGALMKANDATLKGQMHYTVARVHFAESNYQDAISEWGKAIALSPPEHILKGSLLARGGAYYEVAKLQDAAGDTVSARTSYEASLDDMKALLESSPSPQIKDSAFRTLGAGMIRLGRQKEAADYYQQLISASADPQEQATFSMLLTELYYDQQDFVQAEKFARQLLVMDFTDDNGAGYYRKERAYSIVGNALMQQKKYEEAARVFTQGLKSYPNSGESGNLSFSKAFAEISYSDYVTAAESFKAFVDKFPQNANRIHGQYYLAHSLQAMTQFTKAAAEFRALADNYSGSQYEEESLFLIGENYYNEQAFGEAIEAYDVLLGKYPQGQYGGSAQYAMAWSYVEQEEMQKAVAAMLDLVANYPHSEFAPKAQFTIGDYYYNIQSYDEAMVAYRNVFDQYPDSEEAPRARTLVGELSEIQASFDYNAAMKFFEAKDFDKAVPGLQDLIKKYPGTYTELAAYCNLGLAYEITRQWAVAAENYQVVTDKGGNKPENADVVSFAKLHRDWIVENRL
ncbi:MAG TPA: tetratricopeptide repeat protein [Candidatus Handelsmanbacteria bacterium]|nr:tetratricopeptide repeat protein [Candidatus Handelsmanbacteria bacterium]